MFVQVALTRGAGPVGYLCLYLDIYSFYFFT